MSDPIDRQAAIEAIKKIPIYVTLDFGETCGEMPVVSPEATLNAIQNLPSAQSHWISCSERMPESQVEVIVSCTDDSGDTKFRYTSSGWITTNKEYWIVDNEINCFVTAWMPFPEPYKEVEHE